MDSVEIEALYTQEEPELGTTECLHIHSPMSITSRGRRGKLGLGASWVRFQKKIACFFVFSDRVNKLIIDQNNFPPLLGEQEFTGENFIPHLL